MLIDHCSSSKGGRCRLFYVCPSQLASGAPRKHNTFHESRHCPEAQAASMVWSGPHLGWILRQTFGNWAQFSKVSWQESSIPKIFPLTKCHRSIWMCGQSFFRWVQTYWIWILKWWCQHEGWKPQLKWSFPQICLWTVARSNQQLHIFFSILTDYSDNAPPNPYRYKSWSACTCPWGHMVKCYCWLRGSD